jgi:transcriptional regulator with XRE-family HTH domain
MPGTPLRRQLVERINEQGGVGWVLDRYRSGETIRDIAESLGVTRSLLGTYLNRKHREAYDAAKKEHAAASVDEARSLIDKADLFPEAINKAKAQAEIRKWHASRLAREEFGDSPKNATQINIHTLHLDALRVRLVPEELPGGEIRRVIGAESVDLEELLS